MFCARVYRLRYGRGAMILTAIMKPILPNQIGLWIGPGVFNFGIHEAGRYGGGVGLLLATGIPAHDVLGWWYVPVALAIGALFLWVTTKLVQMLIGRMRTRRPRPPLRTPVTLGC